MKRFIFYVLLFGFALSQDVLSGYLKSTEVSFCMDECGLYHIENEFDGGFGGTPVVFGDNIDLEIYLNRFVEVVVSEQEVNCIECSALEVLNISLSQDCNYPVSCFADPCSIAEECQLNTPVDCVSNYCGGCYADFYDLDNNLVYCYDDEENDLDDECRQFESQDECLEVGCEWSDEGGCYGSWGDDEEGEDEEDLECSDINNPFECYAVGCDWESVSYTHLRAHET